VILGDRAIRRAVESGDIVINPFDAANLGSNSYDVRLGRTLARYKDPILDAKVNNPAEFSEIGPEGIVLVPNQLYLGVTEEQVGSRRYVAFIDGKSSAGRLGISIHVTAGRGDVGFFGSWTLEIFVIQAVRVYAGMPIGQFTFYETGEIDVPYDKKSSAKYGGSKLPQTSAMWKNFR
jgi:dCTP deaminase